jgi:hypothetical protein
MVSADGLCWVSDCVSSVTGAGRLEADRPGAIGAGRLGAGGPGDEAGGPCDRCRLRIVGDGGVGSGRTEDWDRVAAKALGLDALGWDDRMPERAMEMCPRAVAGLCGWFFRIIAAVRLG